MALLLVNVTECLDDAIQIPEHQTGSLRNGLGSMNTQSGHVLYKNGQVGVIGKDDGFARFTPDLGKTRPL